MTTTKKMNSEAQKYENFKNNDIDDKSPYYKRQASNLSNNLRNNNN